MAEGTITRKDIITDEALQFGQEYANNVQVAIDKNAELKKSAQEMFEIYKKFASVKDQSNFKDTKEAEALAFIKAKNAIREREEALKSAEKIKREAIKTEAALAKAQDNITKIAKKTSTAWKEQDQLEKNLISTKKKRELASESTNRALIKEREALRQENLEIKRSMSTMGRLTSLRDRARKSVQELNAQVALGKPLSDIQQKELRESVAEFEKYNKALTIIRRSTGQFQDNVGNYPNPLSAKALGSATRQLIPVLGVVGALRAGLGILRDASRTVRDFDRQLIAVQKTTNLSDKEIKLFNKDVRDLGLELKGVSIQGLLESSEVAGQLGIKGRKNILGFAKAIELLKVSAKGINDETVADFAKFIEVSKDSAENADRLSSVVTDLGNNFATTEKEVITSAIEIQKGVQIYNVSAQAVLGLAGATTALGIQDAAARTSIRKSLGVIEQAIFTGKNLEEVLRLTGLTQEELSNQFKNDTTGVFVKFLKGLNDMTEGGENTQEVLQKMKLAGDRVAPTLLSLATKHELTAQALGRANDEYVTNTAALKEAELAAKSLDVKIGDLEDTWDALVLSVETGDGKISGFFKGIIEFLEGAVKGMILFNENFDDLLQRVENSQKDSTYSFELEFIQSLSPEEAEAYSISQLKRTDDLLDKEREKLELLKKQRKEVSFTVTPGESERTTQFKYQQAQAKQKELREEIEKSTRSIAALEGRLKAYEETLGITDEEVEKNTTNLKSNTGETIRNVAFLRAKIVEEKKLIELAVNNDEVKVIEANIKAYEDELNAILGVVAAAKQKSKAAEDAFNLQKQRIQQNVDIETKISSDSDRETGVRLNASLFLYREQLKILSLEKDFAIKNAQGRADEIIRINEKYNNDLILLNEARAERDEKIFEDAFEKAKTRVEKQKQEAEKLQNQEINQRRAALNALLQSSGLTDEQKLAEVEQFEKDVSDIKLKYAKKAIDLQIAQVQKELLNANLSFEQRKSLEEQLYALKVALNELETQNFILNAERRAAAELKFQQFKQDQIRQASNNIASSLGLDAGNLENLLTGLTDGFGEGIQGTLNGIQTTAAVAGDILNSVYNNNLDRIDEQIQKSEEYYNKQYELAEGDRDQQDAIRAEQDLKRAELEKKKRTEQIKQARFQKLNAATQIAFSTAQAILGIWAQVPKFDFGVSAGLLTGFVSALGAAQIAAVLAKPIPKYAEGTEHHPGGLAEVAENRPEVIHEPGKAPYIQKTRATLDLPEGTKVYKSLDYYREVQKASMLSSISLGLGKIQEYEAAIAFDFHSKEVVDELKRNTQAIKDNGKPAAPQPLPDFNYHLFRAQNIDWSA